MANEDHLRENYEHAFFALLMAGVAEIEGEKALRENEALAQDPAAAVPADVDRACRRTIRRAFRKERSHRAGRITWKVVKGAALAALLAAMLVNTVFALSPEIRAGTLNILMDTFNNGMSFGSSPALQPPTPLEDVKPSYVPEGFELVQDESFDGNMWVKYNTPQGDRLEIILSPSGNFDMDGAEIEWIEIHGLPTCVIDQTNTPSDAKGCIKLIITNEEENYILSVIFLPHSPYTTPIIDKEELISTAESIFESRAPR